MKRMFLIALLCTVVTGLTGCAGGIEMLNFGRKAPEPTKNGRYQMAVTPQGAVIKMDTATGDVWWTPVTGPTLGKWEKAPN